MLQVSAKTLSNPQCGCCPYGYHIDLDFVRYCESMAAGQQGVQTVAQIQRRERRRQRQSMDVLLGIIPPEGQQIDEQSQKYLTEYIHKEPPYEHSTLVTSVSSSDTFDDAVLDFERTLQRSSKTDRIDGTKKAELEEPISASMVNSIRPPADYDDDGVGSNTSELSTNALQNIREQMALSLSRMRDLEDEVKLIPMLKLQLSVLQQEKNELLLQIKSATIKKEQPSRTIVPHRINPISIASLTPRIRSSSLSEPFKLKKGKDVETMCSIITRDVGISPIKIRNKNVGTGTDNKYQDLYKQPTKLQRSLGIQTDIKLNSVPVTIEKKVKTISIGTQMLIQKILKKDVAVQSSDTRKSTVNVSVTAKPISKDSASQAIQLTRTIGSSECTILDVTCEKCKIRKKSVAVGPDQSPTPVSLSLMNVPRSRSFNYGEEKLSQKSKSQTTQTIIDVDSRYSQTNIAQLSKEVQCAVHSKTAGVQYDIHGENKITDTSGLIKLKENSTATSQIKLVDVCCGEAIKPHIAISCAENYCDTCKDYIKNLAKEFSTTQVQPIEGSRIPRPVSLSTPSENRKFRRQDTYTKIPALKSPEKTSPSTSNIRINVTEQSSSSTTTGLSDMEDFTKSEQRHSYTSESESDPKFYSKLENSKFRPIHDKPRQKLTPSKEMAAALKVLNDSIQKSTSKGRMSHLKNANNIVQQEWFQISSTVTANPLHVEDFLDYFEVISSKLLHYVVNMADASGNTAMHYAVSHGNFDVVSILLDSKVCNINQSNFAGYTSVMLVSLAELRSPEHRTVVNRLFQLADVNIRAKQHGQTALMLAVSHGRVDMVSMLLEAGADVNIQDEDGSTALMCAAEHGYIEIVKLFIAYPDCDSSIVDMDGSTALKIALEANNRDIGVLLYAHEHMSRGSSPYTSLKQRRSKPSTPTLKSQSTSHSSNGSTPDNKSSKDL